MDFFSKLHKNIFGRILSLKNHSTRVKILDEGRTFSRIESKSIIGNGTIVLNANAVSTKERSKLRIDRGRPSENL